ncbi:hypothetical protein B566_EDAN001478 [Ephemera danica]|nr:hypothetical protein B566_EDAN001478 [Ephemera danica]
MLKNSDPPHAVDRPYGNVGSGSHIYTSVIHYNNCHKTSTVAMANCASDDEEYVFFYQKKVTSPATSQYPSMDEFPGNFDFEMDIGQYSPTNKRQAWQYSTMLKKIYATEGRSIPLKFRMTLPNPCVGYYVRAVAVYTNPDSVILPVLRCTHHLQTKDDPLNRGYEQLDHVVSTTHRRAVYEVDAKTKRRSVSIPLTGPQPGTTWQTIMYSLMCRSSCTSGINRRPFALVFTLEFQVCASPHRDRLIDENRVLKKENPYANLGSLNGRYYIPVVNYEDYLTLVKEARLLTQRELPEGPEKARELFKFDHILMEHLNLCSNLNKHVLIYLYVNG